MLSIVLIQAADTIISGWG